MKLIFAWNSDRPYLDIGEWIGIDCGKIPVKLYCHRNWESTIHLEYFTTYVHPEVNITAVGNNASLEARPVAQNALCPRFSMAKKHINNANRNRFCFERQIISVYHSV